MRRAAVGDNSWIGVNDVASFVFLASDAVDDVLLLHLRRVQLFGRVIRAIDVGLGSMSKTLFFFVTVVIA
jgi:hypothetical protein